MGTMAFLFRNATSLSSSDEETVVEQEENDCQGTLSLRLRRKTT